MKELITKILSSGTGIGVECMGGLFAYELESGKFVVSFLEMNDSHQECIQEVEVDTAEEAANRFLKEREERKLGFDFER